MTTKCIMVTEIRPWNRKKGQFMSTKEKLVKFE